MRLVNMDVDRYGSSDRCRLGPLSPGLNAICGPRGSGKTALLYWLRMVMQEQLHAPNSTLDQVRIGQPTASPVSGCVEIENQHRSYSIATDRNGRFEYLDADPRYPYLPLTNRQRAAFVGLASAQGTSDTEQELSNLARQLDLTMAASHTGVSAWTEAAQRRIAEVQSQLEATRTPVQSRDQLVHRRDSLQREIDLTRSTHVPVGHAYRHDQYAALEAELKDCVRQVEDLEASIQERQAKAQNCTTPLQPESIDKSYRQQLQQLDDRLNRWRQTLRDLKSHRESIEFSATDARLDKQIGDQLSTAKDVDPRLPMRSLETQILSTRKQLDVLVARYAQIPGYDYRSATSAVNGTQYLPPEAEAGQGVYRDQHGNTFIGNRTYLPEASALPETLRSMQRDLNEVCQQLARHEANSATETLRQQTSQLSRCERELLQSIEQLIAERGELLRRIATENHLSMEQLTLAYGDWCQCHDHTHLTDWLLSEESHSSSLPSEAQAMNRQQLLEEIEALQKTRQATSLRADDCRRQMRELDTRRQSNLAADDTGIRRISDIERELDQVCADLEAIGLRDRLQAELSELKRTGAETRHDAVVDSFQNAVDRHITNMMPAANKAASPQVVPLGIANTRSDETRSTYRYGVEVPRPIVRLAMRLAIAECLSRSQESIPVLLDETIDGLSPDTQQAVVLHLAHVARSGQQIVMLTSDQRVAELVHGSSGWIGYMQANTGKSSDINQHLSALANTDEAEKWFRPAVETPKYRARNDYYLTEQSLIEDLPAIDPALAARCRALGVDRIGDLMDVDPHWLADNLRREGVTYGRVAAWQASADLLCNVQGLRPFDARVLVGTGIRNANQLAEMRAGDLFDHVESFLTTEKGRRILRSGSSYELSRITSWIASARGGTRQSERSHLLDDLYELGERSDRGHRGRSRDRDGIRSSRNSRRSRSTRSSRRRTYPVVGRTQRRAEWESRERTDRSRRDREQVRIARVDREEVSQAESSEEALRFYLELSSPVVDAPTIGPAMAERLEAQGIETVEQLLHADADALAEQLDHRRTTGDTVRSWQQQASLVCRIPNLRGHDAQLLVACELISPEEIAGLDPGTVLDQVTEIAQSKAGQRILRGGSEPDLEEVTDWITWASHSRSLNAA